MADGENREPEPQPAETGTEPAATNGGDAEPEVPAPTDFRRNLWLLVIILGVIVAAWVVAVIWKGIPDQPSLAGVGQPAGSPSSAGTAVPAAQRLRQQPQPQPVRPQPVVVADVVGTDMQIIPAAPPRALRTGDALRNAQYFDITRTAEGFDLSALIRMPNRMADQVPVLTAQSMPEDALQPAADCDLLTKDDRVISVSGPNGATAYPLRLFSTFMAVYGAVGDTPICLTWNRVTQGARGFIARVGDKALTWRDAGLNYFGDPVFYDEQTGSLWDGFSGLAFAGPSAGEKAEQLPTDVWPWEAWREAHPGGQVMVAALGDASASLTQAADEELRLAQYLRSPSLPVPVKNFKPEESPLPAKAFVLGVAAGDASKAYPLKDLWDSQTGPLDDTVGGKPVRIVVTSARTGHLENPPEGVTAEVMLWFAWKESHPDTAAYGAGAAAEGEAAAAEATAGADEPAAEAQ